MTDETENLVLDHLRLIREDTGEMRQDMTGLREEVQEIRHAVAGIAYTVAHQYGQLSERLEALERPTE
jgi:hypothetical protein